VKVFSKIILKVFLFCFAIICLQLSIVQDFLGFSINFPLACIIAFSTMLSMFETVLASVFFMSFVFLLSYDSQLIWAYPVIGIMASKFNPEDIEDKFLVSIVFSLIFGPLLEFFNPNSSGYLNKILYASLSTVIAVIPIYFMIHFFFKQKLKYLSNKA
jgi:hypothetical protein